MVEIIHKRTPYTSAMDVQIEAQLLREGYHLEGISVNKEHIVDIYADNNGHKFVLGIDNTTGFLIAENQS